MALVRTASPPTDAAASETAPGPFEALGQPDLIWSHPESGLRAAAFGEAERREGGSLRAVLSGLTAPAGLPESMPGPWFGAAAFDGTLGPDWTGFVPLRFTLPALLWWSVDGRQFVAAFGEGAAARLDAARRQLDAAAGDRARRSGVRVARRTPRPAERERWDALVSRALSAIAAGSLDKVVVARALSIESGAEIDTTGVLTTLEARYPACRSFLVRGADGAAFLGATPELLCRIEGDRISTEALAGSARPGEAAALLQDGKELREHRWVVDHLVRALEGVGHSLEIPSEPGLRALANVVHLHTPISARLSRGRTMADVVAALHPTPAVGGVPSDAALQFLRSHEHLDRGLYAGLVGWAGPDRAELAVALRSALIRGRRARLFVGGGIVEGSSAEAEWAETEMKARALLDALGVVS